MELAVHSRQLPHCNTCYYSILFSHLCCCCTLRQQYISVVFLHLLLSFGRNEIQVKNDLNARRVRSQHCYLRSGCIWHIEKILLFECVDCCVSELKDSPSLNPCQNPCVWVWTHVTFRNISNMLSFLLEVCRYYSLLCFEFCSWNANWRSLQWQWNVLGKPVVT